MYNLLFIETDHPPTPNDPQVTVRYGDKWNNRVEIGDLVNIIVCPKAHEGTCKEANIGCEHIGYATILGKYFGKLCNLPQTIIDFEHEPVCRKFQGLKRTLENIYGEVGNCDNVTALVYFLHT